MRNIIHNYQSERTMKRHHSIKFITLLYCSFLFLYVGTASAGMLYRWWSTPYYEFSIDKGNKYQLGDNSGIMSYVLNFNSNVICYHVLNGSLSIQAGEGNGGYGVPISYGVAETQNDGSKKFRGTFSATGSLDVSALQYHFDPNSMCYEPHPDYPDLLIPTCTDTYNPDLLNPDHVAYDESGEPIVDLHSCHAESDWKVEIPDAYWWSNFSAAYIVVTLNDDGSFPSVEDLSTNTDQIIEYGTYLCEYPGSFDMATMRTETVETDCPLTIMSDAKKLPDDYVTYAEFIAIYGLNGR